jgi:hypothetical protein
MFAIATMTNRALALGLAMGLAGCSTELQSDEGVVEDYALSSNNGLNMINGLNSTNGLNSNNGLSSNNGLNSTNGLSSNNGLITTDAGRRTISYLVRCALPATRTIQKIYNGVTYRFPGQIGVAPQWETGLCDGQCQEHVSACMLAHVNTSGQNVSVWLDGDSSAIGWGRNSNFPYQEGSFFGNIFASPPQAYYCNGKDFDQGVVPGRLGVGQPGSPYVNPFGGSAYCKDRCVAADYPNNNDGYKACHSFNHVVTVWRNFDVNTYYKVCNRATGKCLDVENASTTDFAKVLQYNYYGGDCQKWKITQVSPGKYKFINKKSGKALDVNNGGTTNGTQIIQFTYNGQANQMWSFTPTGDGFYKFSPGSNPAGSIDVPNGTTAVVPVVQWAWWGGTMQQWSITPAN